MTQQALRELVELAEKATPGPWYMEFNEEHGRSEYDVISKTPYRQFVACHPSRISNPVAFNMEFIAAARNAIPHLKSLLGEQREAQEPVAVASHNGIVRCPNPECGRNECVIATRSGCPSFYVMCPFCCYTGPYKYEPEDAKRLHNLIATPKQPAVAWYDLPMSNIELADAIIQEWQRRVESGSPSMPWGTSELVELISGLRPSAPPLAESVGDVNIKAAAREIVHFLCANESSFVSVSAWTGEQCEQQLADIIRRHMQQGK